MMVPEIAQNEDLQKRIILRSPFGILACPAYAPYNDVEDKSESLLNLPESSFQQPMIKLTGTDVLVSNELGAASAQCSCGS